MKVCRVEAHRLEEVPITPPPFRKDPSTGSMTVVEVETDSGIVGYSVLGGGGGSPWPMTVEFINCYASQFLAGQDALLVERIWNQMVRQAGRHPAGMWASVAGAIDLALWDIRGKALGHPVWQLIGGARDRVPAYVSFGLAGPNTSASMYPAYSREELVEEAKYLVGQGHTRLKTVVGRWEVPDPDEDAARMAAVREAVGPDVWLMMDASCYMSLQDAVRLCKLCEPLHITFFEEPVHANDPRTLAALRKQTSIPLAANPSGFRAAYREMLLHDAVDIVQPNVASIGYTESIAVANMAGAFNVPIANGNGSGPHNIHLQAGMPNGWLLEFHWHNWQTYEAVFQDMPRPREGWTAPLNRPGLGLDPKPGIIKEYSRLPT
ncbi:MAG: mandelate racemase/muconate lactonizing enzyme family protein [Chloroflexota bacterium]|nr:mandelate racemase/muconate lactonizing enzyme family protein [Chloroflexota bacterium]